jgi:HEAT repeat protein
MGGTREVDALIAALQNRSPAVREGATRALGRIGNTRAVEALIGVLQDGDRKVRRAGAVALGGIGRGRAVEALIDALGDDDWTVRQASTDALGEIGDVRAIGPLTELQDYLTKYPSDPFETPGCLLRAEDDLCRSVARALRRLVGAAEAE